MGADGTTDPKFEIGHVLFIDIVGYSKLLIGEQSELVRELKEVVATSEQVRVAEEQGRLVSLPSGDGGALVFRDSEIKHGARISLVNLYGDSIGNADVPEKIRQAKRDQARASRDGRKGILVATSIVTAAVLGIGYWFFHQRRANDFGPIPVKSI